MKQKKLTIAVMMCLLAGLILLTTNLPAQANYNAASSTSANERAWKTPTVVEWWGSIQITLSPDNPLHWIWNSVWAKLSLIRSPQPGPTEPPKYCGGDDGFILFRQQ